MKPRRIDEDAIKAVAKRLREVREAKGVSQETVYIDTEYNIGRIEAGKTNITISTLSLLCKHYGITLKEFFSELK